MDGILVIDKPAGITSHDVVARARRILRIKRIGHTGTLDPFATGVLVLMVGKATRLAQFLDKNEKEYEAEIRFGFETDTGDVTGVLRPESEVLSEDVVKTLRATDWEELFSHFRGDIEQVPPMYSAKKIEGRKLYELARKGESVERRPVKISVFELERLAEPAIDAMSITIRVVCSAGTYIRTLAEDVGRKLGTGAHLTKLRRTRAGIFSLTESIGLANLENSDDPRSALLPMDEAINHLPLMELIEERVERTKSGLSTRFAAEFSDGQAIQMRSRTGELIAVGFYEAVQQSVRPKIVLV